MSINNLQQNSIFKSFSEFNQIPTKEKVNYNAQNQVSTQENQPDATSLASVQISDLNKKKSNRILKYTVSTSVIAAGIAGLFLSKGFSSGSYKNINKLIDSLNNKIYATSIEGTSQNLLQKINIGLSKTFKGILTLFKAFSNFNASRDSSMDWILRQTKLTEGFADNVTKWFKSLSYNAVNKAYDKAATQTHYFQASVTELIEDLRKSGLNLSDPVKIKGEEKTIAEWLTELEKRGGDLVEHFDSNFKPLKRNNRAKVREDYLNGILELGGSSIERGLSKQVQNAIFSAKDPIWKVWKWNILNPTNWKKYLTYVTEDLSQPGKEVLRTEIVGARKVISNGLKHNVTSVESALRDISTRVNIVDEECAKLLSEISSELKKYPKGSGNAETIEREAVSKKIISILNNLKSVMEQNTSGKNAYSQETIDIVQKQIDFIDKALGAERGDIEHIMKIISGLNKHATNAKTGEKAISGNIVTKFQKDSDEISDLVTKATEMESGDLFDKCAEFKVGSAPNDLVNLILPIGVGAYAVSKAKDKDDKVSATLTTAVPLVGGIGMMFIGAAKMFSGAKNLVLSTGVGIGLNIIGNLLTKIYLSYQEKRSFTEMAIEAYKNSAIYKEEEKK